MSILNRFKAARGYVAYRVRAEIEYLRQFSATFQYLERTYRWWRHNFPEYIHPSSLPNPPGTPPVQPTWTVAPVAVLLQRIPVWEMQLDNLLLFGHTMPTNAEVEYRRAYLQWADDFKRGVHRPLPVDEILRDARTVRVPVYEHPFVHEELWGFVAARAREAGARWLPFPHIVPPRELPPLPRHWRNFVTVRDEAGRWLVVRPAQLRVAVASADGADAAAGPEALPQAQQPGAQHRGTATEDRQGGGAEMRAAADDMRAAAQDAWHIFGAARASAAALTPMALEFARDRLDTLRAALSEFMKGYSEGARETNAAREIAVREIAAGAGVQVESGSVDVAEDARQFYHRMLHTLPDTLATLDSRLQPRPPPTATPVASPRGRSPDGAGAGVSGGTTSGGAGASADPVDRDPAGGSERVGSAAEVSSGVAGAGEAPPPAASGAQHRGGAGVEVARGAREREHGGRKGGSGSDGTGEHAARSDGNGGKDA